MATNEYNFQYVPLNGKLPGEVMVQQTQDAINDLGNRVISGAEADAAEAVEKADNAVNASSEAVETANNAETIAQEAYDYITGEFPKVHFVGVKSTATSDSNYTGGGATGTDSIAIGVSASATNTNSVAVGTGSVASGANEVSVGNDNTKRKITNVAEGSGNNDVMTYGQGVDRTSAQTISGEKTFSTVPKITGAISTNDDSQKSATTAYVKSCVPASVGSATKPVYTDNNGVVRECSYALRIVEISEENDEGEYYECEVPSEKVFANFDSIGGKTIAWNQLVINGNFNDSSDWTCSSGSTFSVSNNVSTVIAGSGTSSYMIAQVECITGRKYYVCADFNPASTVQCLISRTGSADYVGTDVAAGTWTKVSGVFTASADSNIMYYIFRNVAATCQIRRAMVVDLTLAFGGGNEPTAEQFEAMFPDSYYEYNAGTLLSASVDKVISKDSSNNTIATMPIPSAIQSLDGYGWSAGSKKNYIDFERKKFVKQEGSVDLGSLSWSYRNNPTSATANTPYFYTESSDVIRYGQGICEVYVHGSETASGGVYSHDDKTFTFVPFHYTKEINVFDSAYTDATTFKTAMAGVMLYYELATPIETDISAILGASGIATSSGGSLTFQNSNGDNYRLPVPISMDYVVDDEGLITSQDKAKLDEMYNSMDSLVQLASDGANYLSNATLLCEAEQTGSSTVIVNNVIFKPSDYKKFKLNSYISGKEFVNTCIVDTTTLKVAPPSLTLQYGANVWVSSTEYAQARIMESYGIYIIYCSAVCSGANKAIARVYGLK